MIVLLASWVMTDARENLSTDWTAFDNAATRLFNGENVYVPYGPTEPLPYLYPPFALLLVVPLGFVGFFGSWAVSVAMTIAALTVGIACFARSEPQAFDRGTGIIVSLASGTTVTAALIGQYSGIYVAAVGGGGLLWSRDRKFAAGFVLAVLVMKPNLAIAVPVCLLWSRSWRALGGFATGTLAALLASIPFGLGRWEGFFSNVAQMGELQGEGRLVATKMVTMLGLAESWFGLSTTAPAAIAFWLVTTAFLGLIVLLLWRRDALEQSSTRAFSALAIFMIVANPRMYFYDAALVVLGLFGFWMAATTIGGDALRRWMPRICAVGWLVLWGGVFPVLNAFVPLVCAVAMTFVAHDSLYGEQLGSASSGSEELVDQSESSLILQQFPEAKKAA